MVMQTPCGGWAHACVSQRLAAVRGWWQSRVFPNPHASKGFTLELRWIGGVCRGTVDVAMVYHRILHVLILYKGAPYDWSRR